jgi:hypothetical protein
MLDMLDSIKSLLLILLVSIIVGVYVVMVSGCEIKQNQTSTGGDAAVPDIVQIETPAAEPEEEEK